MTVGPNCKNMCPHLAGTLDWECIKERCAWWVESGGMCAIKLQAEMLAKIYSTMERQVREDRRTVRGTKKE